MKNKPFVFDWSVFFFLLTVALAFFSWMGSIYGMENVQSLLSAEGVRWVLSHVVENYVETPALGIVLILFMGIGISSRAGLVDALRQLFHQERRQLSRKERRSLMLALIALLVYGGVVFLLTMLPWNFLQGITGSWVHSPLSKGFVYILSVGIGLSGMVYGYASDAFRGASDVVNGMSCLIARKASYFVSLFFVVQFFYSLDYTRMAEWMNWGDGVMEVMFQLFCFLPLLKCRNRV